MSVDADVLIVGAGAAGLSLAVRLKERAPELRVHLVDGRSGFEHDRTFSSFATTPHPFEAAIDHRYGRVALFDGRTSVHRACGRIPYTRVAGDLFYAVALRKLGAHAELTLGCRTAAMLEHDTHVEVETDRGVLRATVVIDARGKLETGAEVCQVFLGQVVRVERPIFDPDLATLMDFRAPQDLGAHFVYVLPTSRTEALVEDTYFAASGGTTPTMPGHEASIRAWLERAGAGAYEVLRSERGVLPMTAKAPPPSSGRIVRAGISGGSAKGSTGYAFAFIQRHVLALAVAMERARLHERPRTLPSWPAPRSPVATYYDRVFLRYVELALSRAPGDVGTALLDLFARAPLASVARFLSEEAGPLDYAQVMAAMPTVPFLRAAFSPLDH